MATRLRVGLSSLTADWIKLDLDHIDNWSLWFDLKILLKTVGVVLADTGS